MAAAPADFRPAAVAEGKLKRRDGALDLDLQPTEDILAGLAAAAPPGQTIVGFAAEHGGDAVGRARGEADPQGRRPDRPQRRLRPADRLRERRERGNPGRRRRRDHVPRAAKDAVADAILDRVDSCTRIARSRLTMGAPGRRAENDTSPAAPLPGAPPGRTPSELYWPQLFCPYRASRSGPGPLFLRPNRALSSDLQQNIQEPAFRARLGNRPGRHRAARQRDAAPLHRPPRAGSTSRSANGSPSHLNHLRADYALEVSSPGDKYRRKRAQHHFRDQGVVPVSKEIVDAVKALEQEKGISADKLMDALEDALLSAYKKTPGAAKYARVDLDHETGDFLVFELILPAGAGGETAGRGGRAAGGARSRPGDRRTARARGPRAGPGDDRPLRGPDHDPRRDPRRLRPDRRADRQAGDPAADPRGRAADDVRRVPGPGRRADHRDHPAVRQALHAGPAARAGRGAAAEVRAGLQRALRPRDAGQGGHHRRLRLDQRPGDRRLPPQPGADQKPVRARGARRSPTAWSKSSASPASPATARRSPSSPTPTGSTRSAPASARAARASAWSSPSCAARRSTSSPTTTSPPGSSPKRSPRPASAR